MNVQRDPDPILAAWLHEGPTRLPDADAAGDRGIHPNHPSIAASELVAVEGSDLNGMTRSALAAVAVVAVVVGGLYFLRPGTDQPGGVGGPASPVPSASPSALGVTRAIVSAEP